MRRINSILWLVSLTLLLASCGYADAQSDLCRFWHTCGGDDSGGLQRLTGTP